MDNLPDEDELFVDMVATVTFDVLARLGQDGELRVEFFRRYIALAKAILAAAGEGGH